MDKRIECLPSLLIEAGKIMISAHDAEGDVQVKPGTANFVTAYDVAVQTFLVTEIGKRIPEAVFLAEEQENDMSVLQGECCFVIDPIDGTTNFIHDYRFSAISLAMLCRGRAVFGAVYNPYSGEMFTAEAGKGAWLNGKPIHVSEREAEQAAVAFGTSPYYKDELAQKTFSLAHTLFLCMGDLRRGGSAALDLAYLAAGRVDAFFEWRLSPWDFAAGMLLVSEAGGVVTDHTGAPPDLSAVHSVFAGNAKTHPILLAEAAKL